MFEIISSLQNATIKNVVKLQQKSSARNEQGLFVIEGLRELGLAIQANYIIDTLFFCSDLFKGQLPDIKTNVYEITTAVFEKIAYRSSSDGIIALAKTKQLTLEKIKLSSNPLLLVIEAVEKPGNLGALLRTADAAALDAVIVCDKQTDVYNPNVVRSSVGCLFTNQLAVCNNQEVFEWLKVNKINSYAASLAATNWYHENALNEPTAFIMGTESTGLTDFWLKHATNHIKIPMQGKIDSLNVSVSAAILVFEAKRQRGFK
jgi:RNA methyltransferase, TrmH family